jgi:signal transduction histidine kinase
MAVGSLARRELGLRELGERAELLLRDALGERPIVLGVDEDATVRADEDKLMQILLNLLANAIDATAAGGEVGLSFRATATGGELSVWDTGPGFVGEPAKLFAPWYTTKPKGSGLGLAITYRLVRSHGWDVAAGRRDGRTVFSIAVPAADLVGRAVARRAGVA